MCYVKENNKPGSILQHLFIKGDKASDMGAYDEEDYFKEEAKWNVYLVKVASVPTSKVYNKRANTWIYKHTAEVKFTDLNLLPTALEVKFTEYSCGTYSHSLDPRPSFRFYKRLGKQLEYCIVYTFELSLNLSVSINITAIKNKPAHKNNVST